MRINTQDDWYEGAATVIPKLDSYADEFGLTFDQTRATQLLNDKNHAELWSMFQKLWEDLPDRPDIHITPFHDLCDLCSEYWVFQEE